MVRGAGVELVREGPMRGGAPFVAGTCVDCYTHVHVHAHNIIHVHVHDATSSIEYIHVATYMYLYIYMYVYTIMSLTHKHYKLVIEGESSLLWQLQLYQGRPLMCTPLLASQLTNPRGG